MSSGVEAARLEATIRQIHKEVLGNRHILEDKESRVPSAREIAALESQVADLRSQLSALESANSASHSQLSQLQRTRDAIRQQTTQLVGLADHFATVIPNGDVPELPPDVRADVLRKVDEVVETICHEFGAFDASEFSDFLTEIHRVQSAVDSEIDVLSQIASDDWDPPNDLQISLEEFCTRYPVRPATTTTLSAVDVPHAMQPLEVFERRLQADLPPPPRVEGFNAELSDLVGLLNDQRRREQKIYDDQSRFLQQLKDAASRHSDAPDDNPIGLFGDIEQVVPLSIPPPGPSSDSDPVAVLRGEFEKLVKELKGNCESLRLVEEFEARVSGALSIPEFRPPPKPKVVRHPVPSPQLAELADQLSRVRDGASRVIPADVVQSLVQSQRLAVSAQPQEAPSVPLMPLPALFEVPDDQIQADLSDFRAAVTAKLPTELGRRLEEWRPIPQIEDDEVDIDDETDPSAEAPFECGLEERASALNVILRSMASLGTASVPTVVEPPRIQRTPDNPDPTPLLDAVDELLASTQQNPAALNDEVADLDRHLAATRRDLVSFREEEDVDDREQSQLADEIAVTDREIAVVTALLLDEAKETKRVMTERNETSQRVKQLKQELEDAADIDAELDRKRKDLAAAKEKYIGTKAKFDEEQSLLDQLRAGAQGEEGA